MPAPTPEATPAGGAGQGISADASGTTATAPTPVPQVPEALAFPRAGFWERMGAAFLDVVLVGIVCRLVHAHGWSFLIALAYFAGLWAFKGTTVGGVVLNLKLVRVDGQRLDFLVALVRGLAAAFSMLIV